MGSALLNYFFPQPGPNTGPGLVGFVVGILFATEGILQLRTPCLAANIEPGGPAKRSRRRSSWCEFYPYQEMSFSCVFVFFVPSWSRQVFVSVCAEGTTRGAPSPASRSASRRRGALRSTPTRRRC